MSSSDILGKLESGHGSYENKHTFLQLLSAWISAKAVRRGALVFIFLAFLGTILTSPYAPESLSDSVAWKTSFISSDSGEHPIPKLMREADEKWDRYLQWQPKTYAEAYQQYQDRYGIKPPKGFLFWWQYAQKNNVTILDGFDGLMNSLEPFRKMGSAEMRRRVDIMMVAPKDMNAIWVHKKSTFTKEGQWGVRIERSNGILEMLKPVQEVFNTLKGDPWMIPVNELAEPRILPTEKEIDIEEEQFYDDSGIFRKVWERHDFGEPSLIRSIKKACGEWSSFSRGEPDFKIPPGNNIPFTSKGKAFITNIAKDIDICSQPDIVKYHSAFRTRHWTTKTLYPALSYGAPSIYGDIVIPTHYQHGNFDGYTLDERADKPWDEKEDMLYWHGSPTGGGNNDPFFGSMHRHRVLKFFSEPPQETELTGASAPPENTLTTHPANLTFDTQTNLSFVFPEKNDCWFFDCKHLSTLPHSANAPFNETWGFKYLADLDGWGYSARFRALMASRSAVFKSSIYREWWNERAIPWKHYVPISVSGKEWGDALTYFLGHPDVPELAPHDDDGHAIATAGRHWANQNMRKEDMTAYVFRVFLEFERLYNENYLPGTNRSMAMKLSKERWAKVNKAKEDREKRRLSHLANAQDVALEMAKELKKAEEKKKLEDDKKAEEAKAKAEAEAKQAEAEAKKAEAEEDGEAGEEEEQFSEEAEKEIADLRKEHEAQIAADKKKLADTLTKAAEKDGTEQAEHPEEQKEKASNAKAVADAIRKAEQKKEAEKLAAAAGKTTTGDTRTEAEKEAEKLVALAKGGEIAQEAKKDEQKPKEKTAPTLHISVEPAMPPVDSTSPRESLTTKPPTKLKAGSPPAALASP